MTTILLVGDDGLVQRVAEGLHDLGEHVELLLPVADTIATERAVASADERGIHVHRGSLDSFAALSSAGGGGASSIALLTDDDVSNMELAMMLAERQPDTPVTIRLYRNSIADSVRTLLPTARVLSASELAGGEFLDCLAAAGPRTVRRRPVRARIRTIGNVPRLLIVSVVAFVALTLLGAALISSQMHQAFATSLVAAATAGYGELSVDGATPTVSAVCLLLIASGATSLTLIYLHLTNHIVARALARQTGHRPLPEGGHVVIAGLGKVGAHLMARLHEQGVEVVGIDADEHATGVFAARSLGIPFRIGSITDPALLDTLNLERCIGMLAVTDSDMANMEAGLLASSAGAEHVVVRMFDPSRAERIGRNTDIDRVASVAGAAAPGFIAAIRAQSGSAAPLPA